ncbi:MAG: hypothetical protein CL624_04875 [Arcobacter sp.]|nr:hypothetical protein [Arcobacter sp.]|tara:strand:+ start:4619 stop:5872 length:1254 start_codon:yes stop_codon:yes gene_type:complete
MINKLFEYLKVKNISYCILNGYEHLTNTLNTENDIDILFRKDDFKNIESVLKNFCNLHQYSIVQNYHQERYAKNIFLYDFENNQFLNLDIYGELSRKGVVYFSEKEIFNTLSNYKDIPILSTEKEFIQYLIKKLDKNDCSLATFNKLKELFDILTDEQLLILNKFFDTTYNEIKNSFVKNEIKKLNNNSNKIIQSFLKKKKFSISSFSYNSIRILKRIIKPTGLTIAFLGPDGSGKSTIIDKVQTSVLPFRRIDYFHLKPILQKNGDSSTSEPHALKPYSFSKSYIKLLYFIYQYSLGWLKNISILKIKSSLVIFDRYYDDILVDHKRYRYGASKKIAKLFRYFIPKPDLYFILTTDADIIYKRKQEVPFEELERQINEYRKLGDEKKYFNIDVNRTPDEISKEIIDILARKMNERY